jgi:hypothetical protein
VGSPLSLLLMLRHLLLEGMHAALQVVDLELSKINN